MNLRLDGKTALVVGASRGLGRAMAFALAKSGANVAVAAHRDAGGIGAAGRVARERRRGLNRGEIFYISGGEMAQ